jgi:hypothetical protein
MARSDTRYSVYPAPRSVEVVGNSAPALNQAIECWAALLARATADNAKGFYWNEKGILDSRYTEKWEDAHALNPWGMLTEVLKGMRFDPEFANPGALLGTAVEDAHRLEGVAQKWFISEFDGEEYAKGLEYTIKRLVQKLHALDYVHAWAMIVTVQWFWEHHVEGIDIEKDAWWTLAFRRQWYQRHSENKPPTAPASEAKEERPRKRRK